MPFGPHLLHRHSIRLPDYDYARAGAYFITIVTHHLEALFGEVQDHEMRLNPFGQIVAHAWQDLPNHYAQLALGAFCILPNHVHAIIILNDDDGWAGRSTVGAGLRPAPTSIQSSRQPLSEIVRAFKSFSARRINQRRGTPGIPVWQRNYYEHILRDNEEYLSISEYIRQNPANWAMDIENSRR